MDAILSSMSQEMSRLNRLIDEQERKIEKILEDQIAVVTDPANRREVESPRPHLADLTTGTIRPLFSPPQ